MTQTALPPTLLDMVLRHGIDREDYRSLNRLSFGGAPMPEPLYRRLSDAFGCPLTQSYGASEVSGGVCQQLPRDLLAQRRQIYQLGWPAAAAYLGAHHR